MLRAVLCGEFLLHPPCCFMWGVSLLHAPVFYVGNLSYTPLLFYVGSFSYTPRVVVVCGEFLLQPLAVLCAEFLLNASCCFMQGVSLTHPLLFYVGSFTYTPLAVLCGEFLLHAPCCVMWGVSLTRLLLFYVGSFSYTPLAFFFFVRGVTLTHPRLFNVWRFSCKLFTFVTRNLTKQCKNQVCWVKSVYRASDQASVSCHQNDTANEPNGSSQSITD